MFNLTKKIFSEFSKVLRFHDCFIVLIITKLSWRRFDLTIFFPDFYLPMKQLELIWQKFHFSVHSYNTIVTTVCDFTIFLNIFMLLNVDRFFNSRFFSIYSAAESFAISRIFYFGYHCYIRTARFTTFYNLTILIENCFLFIFYRRKEKKAK